MSLILFGCQQAEIINPNETDGLSMKTVTLSAGIEGNGTKASLDSNTGAFTWQSGDVISVLANDGKFYDFTLTTGSGEREAEFEGSIPETADVTTVATYPAIVENGTDNIILSGNTLNYVLPESWTYTKDVSNVPMAATFGEGGGHMAFKQIGGVMRFPVKNLPPEAEFVLTAHDKAITGPFPVDISNLGESAMASGSGQSVVTISYSSDVDGADAEFNVPVPTGTYNNFNVSIKDADGNVLLSKDYKAENKVDRATLLMMKELVLPERAMVIKEVWPFFVDARVVFSKHEGVTEYAFYIDGAEEPVILEGEDLGELTGALVGGEFAHGSTHSVAVAKVIDGTPATEYKSAEVQFTTGRVMQMTYNTGTKFICAGWDDVAIGVENSTVYNEATKKWSMVPVDQSVSNRNMRGYRVQLYAEDKTTLLYDEIPFSSQVDYGGAISNSSWIGKIGGENVLLPTALSFGWLEPGTKYYFRVQTLAEPVVFDSPETGCFEPSTKGYTMSSTRGGCAWSDFIEMSTDAAHVASEYEILYEGFDDMMFNSDMMNAAAAAVPQFLTSATEESVYQDKRNAALYKDWVALPFAERKFSEQGFNTMISVYQMGLTDDKRVDSSTPRYLNEYAGSLNGWGILGAGGDSRSIYPNFGSIRLGQSGKATGYVGLRTPAIYSDKLSDTQPTKCIITVKVSGHTTTYEDVCQVIGFYHHRGDVVISNDKTVYINKDENGEIRPEWTENYTWTDKNNYTHYPTWFEVKAEMNLLNGDVIVFDRPNVKINGEDNIYHGLLTIGEIKIEVSHEDDTFADDGIGTAPDDNINYDVFGLGEFPITYFYTVEPSAYIKDGAYDYELTKARYQEVKDAGFNIALYNGHSVDMSITENKRIHDICAEVGLKLLGQSSAADVATRVQQIKDTFGDSDTYVGEYLIDEPGVSRYDELAAFVDAYNAALPDKEVYINLFPQYAKEATQLGTTYEDYIDQYLEKIKTKSLSYDFYGLTSSNSVNSLYFTNLDLVRSKTLAKKMPFWVITQACETPSCRYPTEVEERWSVWSNIALGSKGISYFCYWTPSGTTYVSLIDIDGNKTVMYDWVKKINADINTVGKKLLPCHADGAIMTATTYYPLYDNAGAGRTNYGPVKSVSGSQSILCGCFRDARTSENGENYKGYKNLVMSEMPNRDVEAYLSIDSSVTAITFTHNNTTETLQLTNALSATVGSVTISYDGATLTLGIPSGEAVLLEY